MLTPREIAAWRAHAPWATDTQVEQDLLLTRAMVAIFSDRFLASQVAMRGGTMLHKLHAAPAARYSEDIDLVAVGKRPQRDIRLALLRVLNPIMGGGPATDLMETLRLAIRNTVKPSRVMRLVWNYTPTDQPNTTMALKVEVNVTERKPLFDLVHVPYAPLLPEGAQPVQVMTYDVDEMLGTKMRALLQREHGRDLFDLAHVLERCAVPGHPHTVQPERVVRAFEHYMAQEGTVVSGEEYGRKLRYKLGLARFRADLRDVLAG
jgi:predicted nucleotidyltransferase component of viral defense system